MSEATRNYIVAALLVVMGLLLLRQQWLAYDRTSRLDSDGILVQGVTRDVRSDKFESVALVEFNTREGETRTIEVPVSKSLGNALIREGKVRPVDLRYLPADENVVDIPGASEASGWTFGFAFVLLGLAGWVFRRARREAE